MNAASSPLLEIEQLSVEFCSDGPDVHAVQQFDLALGAGERVGLVGESGSGKTAVAQAIMRLHDPAVVRYKGAIRWRGEDLLQMPQARMRALRGRPLAMVFQEPSSALNPVYPIGVQITECLLRDKLPRQQARQRAIALLSETGIANAAKRLADYPHMFSGGQRQRIMIAMALAGQPDLLIADEPTTALDVLVQHQILDLLLRLQERYGMAVLMISHDLHMVRRFCQRALVMRAGKVVEQGALEQLWQQPRNAYTRMLLNSRPAALETPPPPASEPLFEARDLCCDYVVKSGIFGYGRQQFRAVEKVSIQLAAAETVGLVGESGSGKSTLARALLGLAPATGDIRLLGRPLAQWQGRRWRRHLQLVLQDPFSSLSPRLTVADIIGEGLRVHAVGQTAEERRQAIDAVLQEVGLEPAMRWRYPHEFSGGQRQRIAIARSLVLRPQAMLLDEPTSALDVSVQGQILQLLQRLQQRYRLGYLLISHDLAVVRSMAHRLLVLQHGKIIESGPTAAVFAAPSQPYTQALMAAVPNAAHK